MNKSSLYNIFLLSCVIMILTGCRGGGGGGGTLGLEDTGSSLNFASSRDGGSSGGGSSIVSSSIAGDNGYSSSPSIPLAHTPEPSSILLLASGLIGMAIYAKTRLKSKNKNKR